MKEYYSKIAREVKVVILDDKESLPKGYMPVASAFCSGRKMVAAIPEELALENIKLANRLAREAQRELVRMFVD